jgi:hypothetical protein
MEALPPLRPYLLSSLTPATLLLTQRNLFETMLIRSLCAKFPAL